LNGLAPMLRKEATEVRRTSRIYVLPAVFVFAALSGSVLTYFLPVILKAAVTSSPNMTFELGDQTIVDAMVQYFSQLSQLALFALVIVSGGIVSGEIRSGALLLVITKPVSRAAFIMSKIVSQAGVVVVSALLGTLIFAVTAYPLFGSLPLGRLLAAIGLWLLLALLFICLMVLISSRVRSFAGAAGIGIGVYAVLALFSVWPPLETHSPAGLLSAADAVLRGSQAALIWPVVSTIVLIGLVITAALLSFQRAEI
jgi:ABC-2 type transport system permease protein